MNVHMPLDAAAGISLEGAGKDGERLKRQVETGRLKEACRGFEEIFINMMLKEMRKAVPKSGLLPDSLQKDIYTSMFDQQIAREISTGKGIGISEMLYENLSAKLR